VEEAGVKLVAENEAAFYAAMARAYESVETFGTRSKGAARDVGALEEAVKRALRIDQLTDRLQTQQKQLGILQRELEQTKSKYGEASIAAQKKALALEKLEGAIRSGERELVALKSAVTKSADAFDQASRKTSAASEIMTGALRRVGEIATNAFLEAGQAAARFAVDSVKTAGNFEAGMNRFGAITGDSLDSAGLSLKNFSDLFLQLGKDTAFSAGQAQEAAINLAKGGIDPAVIAAGGLSSALALAAAGELDLAQAAEITAKQYGVWVDRTAPAAEQAAFLAKSADLLAQAANASTVDVDELGLGLANVGGIAKTTGLSFDETVQALALLAPGFSSAADAGTSFKVFLTRLQPTTKTASKAMADLNLLTAEGKSVFFDASGQFVGMGEAAELLQSSLERLNPAQRQAALSAIFGQDAFRTAAFLAEQGAEGYARMGVSMAQSGTAAEVAAQKNQGFNFAVDALLGSLETFQIVAGTLVLPLLTALINEGLIPAANAATLFAEGFGNSSTTFGTFVALVADLGLPTLTGLAAAIVAYATAQAIQATPAILASIPALQAQATQVLANTAAWAAAAAPYAILAATVGAVVYKYQELGTQAQARLAELQQTQPALVAATTAETAYGAASEATRQKLEPYNATLSTLKASYGAAVEELTRLEAYGYRTASQQEAQRGIIAQLEGQINTAATAMQGQVEQLGAVEASSMTATGQLQGLTNAHPALQGQLSLTEQELQKLQQALETTYQKGGEAVGAFVTTEAQFLSEAEGRRQAYNAEIAKLQEQLGAATTAEQADAIKEQIAQAEAGYKEQEAAAATSYAQQQAAQRAHLGQMLIEYTTNQALLGNIGKEEAALLTDAIAQEYGIMEDNNASTFLRMTSAIDEWAANADTRQQEAAGSAESAQQRTSSSIDTLIGDLGEQEQAAVTTKQKMDEYATEYVAEAVGNFVEKEQEAEEYARALRNIPTNVTVRIRVEADPVPEDLRRQSPSPLETAIANVNSLSIQASQEGLPMLAGALGDVAEQGQAAFDPLASKQTGLDIIEGLIDGIEYATPLVDAAMGKVSGNLIDQFAGIAEEARAIGEEMANNLLGGQASSSRQTANNRRTIEGLRKNVADEQAAIAQERERLNKREATIINGERVFDQAKYDADVAALERRERGAQAQKGILAEAEAALKAAREEEAALFDATGDRAAAASLYSFRSGQIAELTQAQLAAATGGEYERGLLDDIKQAQADEAASFMADLQARTGETQRAASSLGGLGANLQADLEEGFRWRNQIATTGKDDDGKRYGQDEREEKAVEAGQYQLLMQGLAPFLTYLTQVGEGTATGNPFKNLQTPNTDPFGQYGGQIGWVGNTPTIMPNTITTSPEGVQYGLWGKAPNFWPRDVEVPSDVSLTNAIPDRWEHRWQLQGTPGQRGPVYIGPKPPGQSMAPRFGDEWVQNAAGEWVIHKLPQYARGIASAPAGLSMVHAGELLINMRGGETVVPAAQVPPWLGQGGNTTYNDNRSYPFAPNYYGAPPAQTMDYALQRLMAQ
jgi:TP901 family phage tail tape measure protein